jgi:hypothetical protein
MGLDGFGQEFEEGVEDSGLWWKDCLKRKG